LPNDPEAHNNLGVLLKDLGRMEEACTSYRRTLQINPNHTDAHFNLGRIFQIMGDHDKAESSLRRVLQLEPDYAEAHINLGLTLQNTGRLDDAATSYRRALQIKPNYAEAHNNLGSTLLSKGKLDEAEAAYRQALQSKPNYADAYNNLGLTLQNMGKPSEAEASYRRALQIKPDYTEAYSNMLFCLSHNEVMEAQALLAEHLSFGEQFEAPLRADWPAHTNSRNPERCLQIGIVSGDLYNHAIAFFIEPLLLHLAKLPQLSLHAYANHTIDDSVSHRLRGYFAHWQPTAGLSDASLAEKIRADDIDILIDLSGHTAKNRLLTFARKPAPIQASWMGYPGTTGLQAMDYYLADRYLLPPGQFDDQFTEKIVRMPGNAPFLPCESAPPVNDLPALRNGYVTFGSFNRLDKLSRSVIELWAQLLRAWPDSRMLLGGMPEEGKYDTLIEWFAQEGIVRERLDFHGRIGMDHYMELHHQVDICLDTFPYTGGTTTYHALWMGVPTLTLSGSTAAGRPGTAILGRVNLDGFAAHNPDDFIQKGLYWAENVTELSNIRIGMRERFAQSAVGQPALLAAGVERALRIMWQRWCAGLPPVSFEVTRQELTDTTPGIKK
jgi:predicted O-linked N-acetylglucosamine transferase (SPINDLY family)